MKTQIRLKELKLNQPQTKSLPERELVILERIYQNYQTGCLANPNWSLPEKKEFFKNLLIVALDTTD